MAGIQFTNSLTKEEWGAISQDRRFDESYRTTASSQEELARNLTERVKKICTEINREPPTKITVTNNLKSSLDLELGSGELRIHPLTFASCKLERDQMSPEQQELYKGIERYISDKIKIIGDTPPFKNLLLQYKPILDGNLKKYENIIPSKELNHEIMKLMQFSGQVVVPKDTRIKIETIIKVTYIFSSILIGIAMGWLANKVTQETLYLPLIGSVGLLTSDKAAHFFTQRVYRELPAPTETQWEYLPLENQISDSKYDLT